MTDYYLFVDEAGDPGLNKVASINSSGSSEWFMMSGVLVSREARLSIRSWTTSLESILRLKPQQKIHFAKLNARQKLQCAEFVAKLPVLAFIVISNKQNMERHRNYRVERVWKDKNWFYNSMARYLIERVSEFVYFSSLPKRNSTPDFGVVFSQRGGAHYGHLQKYLRRLESNDFTGRQTNTNGKIRWKSFRPNHVFPSNDQNQPGLILADIVASAFYSAFERRETRDSSISYAKVLWPVLAVLPSKKNAISGFSVKVLPDFGSIKKMPEHAEATSLLEFFGYPREWRQN